MSYLAIWSKNPAAYIKKGFYYQDSTTTKKSIEDDETIEGGFVDGLFEMFKLREEIKKAK